MSWRVRPRFSGGPSSAPPYDVAYLEYALSFPPVLPGIMHSVDIILTGNIG